MGAEGLGDYNYGQCNALAVSGTTLTKGADLVVNSGTASYISVSMSSATEGVVCYMDISNSEYGTCNALAVSGTTLTKGADLVVNSGNTNYISVSMFSATQGIMCYMDQSNSEYGTCNALVLSGTTLTKGADLVVNSGSTYYISVSMSSATQGVVCYRDNSNSNYGTCNALESPTGDSAHTSHAPTIWGMLQCRMIW